VSEVIIIFLSGVGGVFAGMALLYFAILVTPIITQRLERKKESDE
jgi:hypothetical protein